MPYLVRLGGYLESLSNSLSIMAKYKYSFNDPQSLTNDSLRQYTTLLLG